MNGISDASDHWAGMTSVIGALTIGCAFLAALVKMFVRWHRKEEASHGAPILDFLNGAAIVPFAIMVLYPFSDAPYRLLEANNRDYIALAGGVGFWFMALELFKRSGKGHSSGRVANPHPLPNPGELPLNPPTPSTP